MRLKAVDEKRAREAQNRPEDVRTAPANPGVRHYLYFPKKFIAERAAGRLRDAGFEVEVRKGADGVNWLALATGSPLKDEGDMQRMRDQMEALAADLGGEYDGWEAAVDSVDRGVRRGHTVN